MEWFRFETRSSNPYSFGGRSFTVHAWVLQILTPAGGLIWNYPIAVTVRPAEGDVAGGGEERIPIIDPTRLAQIALLGFGLLGVILLWRRKS